MDRFDIITYCSSDCIDLLDQTIYSWLFCSGANKVHIYTDHLWEDCRIDKSAMVYRIFEPTKDVAEHYARKAKALLYHMENTHQKNTGLLLLDIDCLVVRNIEWLNWCVGDIGVTVYPNIKQEHKLNNISAGFLFLRNLPKTIEFVREWNRLQEDLAGPDKPSADQASLSECAKRLDTKFHITGLPMEHCNSHPNTSSVGEIKLWLKRVEENNPSIIHFAFGLWKRKGMMKHVRELCSG